jgi:hypothetical protein
MSRRPRRMLLWMSLALVAGGVLAVCGIGCQTNWLCFLCIPLLTYYFRRALGFVLREKTTVTDGADGSGLSQRAVETSYAISVAVFLAPLMIWAGLTGDGSWLLFLIPLDIRGLSSTVTLTIRLFVLLFLLLGVRGFVVSVRQPNRVGWFICGHVCLIVYYGIWWFSLLCTLGYGE